VFHHNSVQRSRYNVRMKLALALILLAGVAFAQTAATVPITLDQNRIIIDVRFPMPDGSTTRVRAWVNNAADGITITDHIAKKLGLTVADSTATLPQELHIGTAVLPLAEMKQARVVAADSVAPGLSPEITLPGPLLQKYDLLVDYPNREFTVGPPGSIKFTGRAVQATAADAQLKLVAEIAGRKQNMILDLGSSFTQLPSEVIASLSKANPQWPQMTGAISTANQWGSEDERQATLLRVPVLNIGSASEKGVAVSSTAKGSAVLGANALLAYKVGIDHQHSTVYFDRAVTTPVPEMDVVGLILRPQDDGKYVVAGVAQSNGKSAAPDVTPGDVLVKIDNIDCGGGTMGQAWSLLGGSPGDVRELLLSRDGKQLTVKAAVQRFLGESLATKSK
jgi:hypothetical protein